MASNILIFTFFVKIVRTFQQSDGKRGVVENMIKAVVSFHDKNWPNYYVYQQF